MGKIDPNPSMKSLAISTDYSDKLTWPKINSKVFLYYRRLFLLTPVNILFHVCLVKYECQLPISINWTRQGV